MTNLDQLLPRDEGIGTKALARAASDTLPLPIRDIMDHRTTPEEFMPFLAGHLSVDLWYDDWPIERKRKMLENAKRLAAIKGTRAGLAAFLEYVDAEIIDRVSHPRRFVIGRSAIGVDPIGHKPFTAHLLVRVPLQMPRGAFLIGRTAIGHGATRKPNLEPLERVRRAAIVAKSPETLVTLNYAHKRKVTVTDGFTLDGSFMLGAHTDRKRL